MKISIIVPIYMVEKYVNKCVESIINQTFKNLEIILVDDGSPDNCGAICDEYAKKDSRIKVIHKQNGGLIAARKSGVEVATGDYICFVDGDDWIAPDMYEKISEKIFKYSPDCVITQFNYAFSDRNERSDYLLDKELYTKNDIQEYIIPKMLFNGNYYHFGIYPNCWTKVFKAELLKKHIFDVDNRIRLGEDIAFTFPCIMECNSLAFVDEALYFYRQNPQSMTASYDKRLPQIYLLPYEALLNSSRELNVDLSNQLPYYLLYLINFVIRNEAIASKKHKSRKILPQLIETGKKYNICSEIDAGILPFHTKLLLFALKNKSVLLLKIYKSILGCFIKR